ncbi:CDP-glycerol glycerophosphotransferase family protein, partial [Candidatus Parcubacteria bacterium]|nr:CDP-glycerol glycerophosphotransferase family protein [Candidatus Parcubacteria bacterium]
KDNDFIKEFGGNNIYFEKLVEPVWSRIDQFLVGWHKALVYNNSTKLRDLYGVPGLGKTEDGSYLKYIVKKIIFWPLSRIRFLKTFFKWLDGVLIKDTYYNEVFDKYKPDIVFSTSVVEDMDVFVLKQARQRGIKIIGMSKSWDNLSKLCSRVKPDKMIVWADYSSSEARRFQNFKDKDIIKCGVPQFDFYKNSEYLMIREEFCKMYNIDPNKKIILFCSEGRNTPYDGEVAEIIANYINEKKLKEDCSLLIRPYFIYPNEEKKFVNIGKISNVTVDDGYKKSVIFKDKWDYSKEQIKKFTNMINYADIIVASLSSITLDAVAFDKPIINITFDGYQTLPYAQSLKRLYMYENYLPIIKSGGVWFTDNKEELLNALNSYLDNHNLLSEGREKLRDYFCYKIDGKSGERVAEAVLGYLNS